MTPRHKRIVLDAVIFVGTYVALNVAGAGWWAVLILPFGLWNFYDGKTRGDLP